MPFNTEQENYKNLKDLILGPRRANIVPFVGAGLSMYGPPCRRLPRWGELVERLREKALADKVISSAQADFISTLITKKQYIEALGRLYTNAGNPWVGKAVESILEIEADGISPAAVALMTITWTMLVTTNLDRMLELAHDKLERDGFQPRRRLQVFTGRDDNKFLEAASVENAAKTWLAKIHGTVEDYQSFILTTQQYSTLMDGKVYDYLLKDLFRKNLLIIGFSLSDPDFDKAMDHVAGHFRDQNYPPYVVLSDDVFERSENDSYLRRIRVLQKRNNLKVITYHVDRSARADDYWSGHRELFECLSDLRQAWFENYQSFRRHGTSLPPDFCFVGRGISLAEIDKVVFEDRKPCQVIGFGGEGKTTLVSHWLESRIDRLKDNNIRDVFIFQCTLDSPARFFEQASQHLEGLPSGLSMAEQSNAIIAYVTAHPTLFILDGFEVFQAAERENRVQNPLLQNFLDNAIDVGASILLTTRVPVPEFGVSVHIPPLTSQEVDELISVIAPTTAHPTTLKRAMEHLQGHAQSIRILLEQSSRNDNARDCVYFSQNSVGATLYYNKAVDTLTEINKRLSNDENNILIISSIFNAPFTLSTIRSLLESAPDEFKLSQYPPDGLLEPLVNGLIDQQLLISNDGPATYSLHPNIRDFYRSLDIDTKSLHLVYLNILRESAPERPVSNFSDAHHYIVASYHAAMSENWGLFDKYYQHHLMQGQKDFSCDTLGLWSEILDVTRHVFPNAPDLSEARCNPAYYSSRYARSLKHLGHSKEAVPAYVTCLFHCANEHYPRTAIYLNNFLTLRIYMGQLTEACRMAPWNFATFQWLNEDGVRNQTEHGGYSLGWLAMLRGDFVTAQALYDLAANAWVGHEDKQMVFFDYYPIYFCEMYLLLGGGSDRAEDILYRYLDLSDEYGWQETRARCLIFQSMKARHDGRRSRDKTAPLAAALAYCTKAREALNKIFAPPVEIELLHEQLCVFFEDTESNDFKDSPQSLLQRFIDRVNSLGWGLYYPDIFAFSGLWSLYRGDRLEAIKSLERAEANAQAHGNRLAMLSSYRPISILRMKLGLQTDDRFENYAEECHAMQTTLFETISKDDLIQAVRSDFIHQPTARL